MNRPVAWVPFASEQEARRVLGEDLPIDLRPFTDPANPPEGIDQVEFMVLPYGVPQHTVFARTPEMTNLKVIQGQMAGTDAINPLVPAGVTLCNAAGVHDTATAELAVSLALSRGRNLDVFARDQVAGRWQPQWGVGLADARILILGYGNIGRAIERRVRGFEPASITRVATRARSVDFDGEQVDVQEVSRLLDLLPEVDVLFIIAPHTSATEGLVGAEALAAMPDGAMVVNAGRGPIVDTEALIAECGSGRLQAALDVIDPEPVPADHPLRQTPNVLFSPHVGGFTNAFEPRRNALLRSQLRAWATGEPLANVVTVGPLTV
ncbi:2-hydroxyacid dehydrogenase [Propionibacteriaceae bacterium Y1923]|uniref:2-hydroxyacid dehydrogenase n=1 Tax=Aestuariimicrobium sp. Y1814 TaxID=3418742 RepID=UPI003C29930B